MPAEYMGLNGLCQGYFCYRCGKTCNMVGSGHGEGNCEPNPRLVLALRRLNSGEPMAAFDQGGGCPCGLQKECTPDCSLYKTNCTHDWVYDGTGGGHRGEYVHKCSKCGKDDWFAKPEPRVVSVPANSIPQHANLGSKLAATLDELESDKIKSVADKENADLEKIRKERAALEVLRDETINQITNSIESGKVPRIVVKSYEKRQWILDAVKGNAAHQAVWENLKSWARTNALVIRVIEEHDGGGMESWISITVDPVRPGTRDSRGHSWENKE